MTRQGGKAASPPTVGPRGGTTTITGSGMIRKNLWVSHEENEALRLAAFTTRSSESAIIREGLRRRLGLEGTPNEKGAEVAS